MKRVLVLVEGFTEERFVKDVLAPHLESREIFATPKIVTTKRTKQGPDFKGGITDYQKLENDLLRNSAQYYQSAYEKYGRSSDLVCYQQALERELR